MEINAIAEGNTSFAFELYRHLKEREGNLFLSPYSISTALAMTCGGARENTAKQMAETLQFSLDGSRLHAAFADLRDRLDEVQREGQVQLSIANSLWPQRGNPFLKDYLELCRTYYGASITLLDYRQDPEGARVAINKWAEDKTQGKIMNLIPPGLMDIMARLVLTNAIYFKGNWGRQFQTEETKGSTFTLLNGKKVPVLLMSQAAEFRYAESGSLQVLELPYAGGQLSMLILLPKDPKDLLQLEANLAVGELHEWIAGLSSRKITVFLPRFKATSAFRLDKELQRMGMEDAFSSKANFSGMDGSTDLFISAVVHKAFVDVNEEGTEAAAATAVIMKPTMMASIKVFRADHPFVFLILDNQTRSILFIGRLVDPTKTAE